jgi:hypothetical protein
VSVCGTDSVSHACRSFSGQHFDRNHVSKDTFIRHRLDDLDGYNHEAAPAIILRTLHKLTLVREY